MVLLAGTGRLNQHAKFDLAGCNPWGATGPQSCRFLAISLYLANVDAT